jgi:hypothetical protein
MKSNCIIDPTLRRSEQRHRLYELGSRIIAEGRPKPIRVTPAPTPKREPVTVPRPGPWQPISDLKQLMKGRGR